MLIAEEHGGFTVKDQGRIDFHRGHIQAMARAIDDGVEVFGYTSWGPIDCVSAASAEMTKRYGFVYVDRNQDGSGTLQRWKNKALTGSERSIEAMVLIWINLLIETGTV